MKESNCKDSELSSTAIPNILFESWLNELKPSTFILLIYLKRKSSQQRLVKITNTELSKAIGYSIRTVITAIKDLVSLELIVRKFDQQKFVNRIHHISICTEALKKGPNVLKNNFN